MFYLIIIIIFNVKYKIINLKVLVVRFLDFREAYSSDIFKMSDERCLCFKFNYFY